MSREAPERAELLAALNGSLRQLSAATVMFHQAVADRLGMNITDHKCADVLSREGPLTAGELARRTGLTTGAITGVIDRLEKAGLARRAADPADRRRVIIEPNLKRLERQVAPLFDSMGRAAAEVCARYSTRELALILDFTTRASALALEETVKLREGAGRRRPRARAADR